MCTEIDAQPGGGTGVAFEYKGVAQRPVYIATDINPDACLATASTFKRNNLEPPVLVQVVCLVQLYVALLLA